MRRLIKRVLLTPTDIIRSSAQRLLDTAITAAYADGGTFKNSNYNATIDRIVAAMNAFGTTDLSSRMVAWVDPEYLPYRQETTGTASNSGCRKLYDLFRRADFTQNTAASMPLLLLHSGENYWWNGGVTSNYCSTPNAAANQITGDIVLTACLSLPDWTAGSSASIISKRMNGTNISYGISVNATGTLFCRFSDDGTLKAAWAATSSAAVSFTAGQTGWIRVYRVASTGVVTFYTSSDGTTWNQLGTTQSTTSGNLYNSSVPVCVGQPGSDATAAVMGNIYRAYISTSIGGTPVVDFNPSSFNPSTSQTQWTSATGEVWTINIGTASTGYKGTLVYRNMIMSDAIDDAMASGNVTIGGQTLGLLASTRLLNSVSTNNDLIELSSDVTANNNTFRVSMGNGTNRRLVNGTWSILGANINTSNADPFTARLMLLSSLIDTSQAAASENTMFINQSSVTSTNTTSTNQTFSFDSAYPLNLFGRTNRWANVSLHDLMLVTDITKRTEMENIIRSMSSNFAF